MITRRFMLAGALASVGTAGRAEGVVRPKRRLGAESLVTEAGLGGVSGYVLAEAATGRVLESAKPDTALPPASVAKAITALYALEKLGPAHRFATRIMALGPVVDGILQGDLILVGGGDPTLDTDRLGDLVAQLAAGLRGVTGKFLVFAEALPAVPRISADQPDHVGYNAGLSGLNLNFNRVYFEWKRRGGGFDVSMDARGERYAPKVEMARMQVVARELPLFTQSWGGGVEDWTVADTALNDAGSRWLPVRQTGIHCAEVFRNLCAARGIGLPKPEFLPVVPGDARLLERDQSTELTVILRQMLRFSTNVTAEVVGLAASGAPNLAQSGSAMAGWAAERLGMQASFTDHSGLGPASRVTARAMVQAMLAAEKTPTGAGLRGMLREIGMRDAEDKPIEDHPIKVRAKSGTLNFVSGLAGFIEPPSGRDLVFAIFSADVPRREALAMADREDPAGGKAWTKRARHLQGALLRHWAQKHEG